MRRAKISTISYYLPSATLSNIDLSMEFPEWGVDKITQKLGIEMRHIAAPEETALDLAEKVCNKLFNENNIERTEIDYLIFCTQSPEYLLPTTACLLQNRIGLRTDVGAIDVNQGCSGYIYCLSLSKALINSGISSKILLVTSDTYTKYLHKTDKSNRSIFGDAATATLISEDGTMDLGDFIFGTDGSGSNDLILLNGGARNRQVIGDKGDFLHMNGGNVFNFTLSVVPKALNDVLRVNGLTDNDIDQYVLHQANSYILETLMKLCKINDERFYINLSNTGNTVSSTIPIALKDLYYSGDVRKHRKIVLCGFGVGLSWASCVLTQNVPSIG